MLSWIFKYLVEGIYEILAYMFSSIMQCVSVWVNSGPWAFFYSTIVCLFFFHCFIAGVCTYMWLKDTWQPNPKKQEKKIWWEYFYFFFLLQIAEYGNLLFLFMVFFSYFSYINYFEIGGFVDNSYLSHYPFDSMTSHSMLDYIYTLLIKLFKKICWYHSIKNWYTNYNKECDREARKEYAKTTEAWDKARWQRFEEHRELIQKFERQHKQEVEIKKKRIRWIT